MVPMTEATVDRDGVEREARIERMLAETRKFVEEGLKLGAEQRKLSREAQLAPWQLTFTGFGAGAAVVGALVAILKLNGH